MSTTRTFTEHWLSLSAVEKKTLADQVGTSVPTLSQYAHGHRNPSRLMVAQICSHAKGEGLFPASKWKDRAA